MDLFIWFLHLTLLGVMVEDKCRLHEASLSSLRTPQEQGVQGAAPERRSTSTQDTSQDTARDTAQEPLLGHSTSVRMHFAAHLADQQPDADRHSDADQHSDAQATPPSGYPPEQSVLPTTTEPVAVVRWKGLWAANSAPRDTT